VLSPLVHYLPIPRGGKRPTSPAPPIWGHNGGGRAALRLDQRRHNGSRRGNVLGASDFALPYLEIEVLSGEMLKRHTCSDIV